MKFYEQLIKQREAVDRSYQRLCHNRERDWGLYGVDMGHHALNMAIGGLIPTRLTTIGGRSGSGKTSLTAQIFDAGRRVANGRRPEFLFASWELDPSLLVDRDICNKAGITLRMLNQGARLLSRKRLEEIDQAYQQVASLPVTYQTVATDIDTIRLYVKEFVNRCKEKEQVEGISILPVLVIDYINMAMFEGSGLRTYGIADFMNGLKQLCNEYEMSAIVFAQLNRGVDREGRIPDRADFADSAAIENASDNLIVLYRPEYHGIKTILNPETQIEEDSEGRVLVRVLKGRDYGIGDFIMNCDIKHFRFWADGHEWNTPYYELYSKEEFWIKQFGLSGMEVNSLYEQEYDSTEPIKQSVGTDEPPF